MRSGLCCFTDPRNKDALLAGINESPSTFRNSFVSAAVSAEVLSLVHRFVCEQIGRAEFLRHRLHSAQCYIGRAGLGSAVALWIQPAVTPISPVLHQFRARADQGKRPMFLKPFPGRVIEMRKLQLDDIAIPCLGVFESLRGEAGPRRWSGIRGHNDQSWCQCQAAAGVCWRVVRQRRVLRARKHVPAMAGQQLCAELQVPAVTAVRHGPNRPSSWRLEKSSVQHPIAAGHVGYLGGAQRAVVEFRLGRAAVDVGPGSAGGNARAIVLAGNLLNSFVRNSGSSPRMFVPPIPTKMPTTRTAGADFYACFRGAAKILLKIWKRTSNVTHCYYCCFKPGAPGRNRTSTPCGTRF
jgi:hypothetical protein